MSRTRKKDDVVKADAETIAKEAAPETPATPAGLGGVAVSETIADEKELLLALKEANDAVTEAELLLKETGKKYDDAFLKMHEYLVATGKSASAEYPGIGKVRLEDGPFIPSIKKEDTDNLKAYLVGIGRGDMVKETVNHGTLKTFVNDMLDRGEKLPDFINVYKEPKLKQYFVK